MSQSNMIYRRKRKRPMATLIVLGFVTIFFTVCLGPLTVANGDRCLTAMPENLDDEFPKRFAHHEGESIDLTLEVSNRITHQFVTEIFRIFLTESLGYQRVRVVQKPNTMDALQDYIRVAEPFWDNHGGIPESIINLEVWVPADIDIKVSHDYIEVTEYGAVAPPGRFSWFIPKSLTKSIKKMDSHATNKSNGILWTVFRDLDAVDLFEIDNKDDLNFLKKLSFANSSQNMY